MIKETIKKLLLPVRRLAGEFVLLPAGNYIGNHGCINAASSFITWNQVEGDYLEFGVFEGESFIAAYHAIGEHRRKHLSYGYDTPEYRRWTATPPPTARRPHSSARPMEAPSRSPCG